LSLDKHPVALLIGAGCPSAVRITVKEGETRPLIPDVRGLTDHVRGALAADPCFTNVCNQFEEDENPEATIEDMLSRVRLLSRVAGKGTVRGLNQASLVALEKRLCEEVSNVVRAELPNDDSPYHHFVEWTGAISRSKPLEIFTTNYDLLVEQALEARRIPFFDGFVGSREPFFDLRAIEDEQAPSRWVRLWKLHGSINWQHSPTGAVVRKFPAPMGSDGVLIHPSELKYDESRRMPYLAMVDRLRHFLRQPSAFLVTVGYSFADDHLNEVIIQGVRGNPTSAAYALLYKNLEEEKAAHRISDKLPSNISLIAKDAGVIRGSRSAWLTDPDAAAGTPPIQCDLGDFKVFSTFLRSLSPANREH